MEIIVKLKNPKFCNGCPCWNNESEYGDYCNLGYWGSNDTDILQEEQCGFCNKFVNYNNQYKDCPKKPIDESDHSNFPKSHSTNYKTLRLIRPKKCMKERGL